MWIGQLIQAQAQDQKVSKKSLWEKLQHREDLQQCLNDQTSSVWVDTKTRA